MSQITEVVVYNKDKMTRKCHYLGQVIDGILHGSYEEWYPNTIKEYSANYYHGQLHGIQMQWYNNGRLEFKITTEHGKLKGLQQGWYLSGEEIYNYTQ